MNPVPTITFDHLVGQATERFVSTQHPKPEAATCVPAARRLTIHIHPTGVGKSKDSGIQRQYERELGNRDSELGGTVKHRIAGEVLSAQGPDRVASTKKRGFEVRSIAEILLSAGAKREHRAHRQGQRHERRCTADTVPKVDFVSQTAGYTAAFASSVKPRRGSSLRVRRPCLHALRLAGRFVQQADRESRQSGSD
jgi:hypothetical protein